MPIKRVPGDLAFTITAYNEVNIGSFSELFNFIQTIKSLAKSARMFFGLAMAYAV